MSDNRKSAWVAGIRALATFIEAHDEFDAPYMGPVWCWIHEHDPDEAKRRLAACAVALPGKADKHADDGTFNLITHFGPVEVRVTVARDVVCERVVVGHKTVEWTEPPPGVEMVTRTREIEVVEWHCPESVLAGQP